MASIPFELRSIYKLWEICECICCKNMYVAKTHALFPSSYMLGWTMAGTAISPELLDWTCRNITSTGHGKWYAEGLVPANIQAPICNLTHSSPNATIASPWLTHYNTELFVTQLLHSFAAQNMADAMTHICNNIRSLPVDAFIMDSNRVANATCAAAGKQVNPAPATPAATPNSTTVSAYTNTASVLYAIMFASSATIDSELNIYCAHAPEYVMNLNDIRLNGTVVESILCSSTINGLLSVETAKATIKSVSSRLFATAVQGVGDGEGWSGWLCDNLDADAMNAVGLDGLAVRSMICEGWRCGKVFGDMYAATTVVAPKIC